MDEQAEIDLQSLDQYESVAKDTNQVLTYSNTSSSTTTTYHPISPTHTHTHNYGVLGTVLSTAARHDIHGQGLECSSSEDIKNGVRIRGPQSQKLRENSLQWLTYTHYNFSHLHWISHLVRVVLTPKACVH